ncbi:hypothetical protein B0H14DRAFT_3479281 [Mycena olivaceomarginata]|nr:hypothetical protein B0H14DRAFT_3479281 [Mycena olivaceomarginata]
MPCLPLYYPCPGHESTQEHGNTSGCQFYAVWSGCVRGVYSNSWIARAQTDGFTDAKHRGFKKWHDMEQWWTALCTEQHKGGCPPFEPITFTLNPPNRTHPSSAPCTRTLPAPSAGTSAAAGQGTVPHAAMVPMPAPSPFCGGSSLNAATPMATPTKDEPSTPSLHLNVPPRVTPLTRNAPPRRRIPLCVRAGPPTVTAIPRAAAPGDRPHPSVLVTYQTGEVQRAAAPAPTMYGIRSVAVMYATHSAALAAARLLNLAELKIMVTSNASKLEAWITMKKFVGEDEDA